MASGARRPPAGGVRMEVRRAVTPAPAGGTVYDSRPQRGTLSQIISLSMGWINQVLQGLTAL